jgi:voltage-gated potassium channel
MMATVGDVPFPLSREARTFSIFVMVLGIAALLYTFGVVMEYVLEGHLSLAVRRRLMDNKIAGLRNHFVISGFGRVGSQIAQELAAAGQTFVVVDEKEASIQSCLALRYLVVEGDATSDAILREAGIPHARCLLVATEDDATNISITLSARHLSPTTCIVARANHAETEVKLKLAGANEVLSPYTIAGHRMAGLALQAGREAITGY